jgi:tetratricopeptide (TPR) repeat protein
MPSPSSKATSSAQAGQSLRPARRSRGHKGTPPTGLLNDIVPIGAPWRRFDRSAPLTALELEFITAMRPEVEELNLVSGPSPDQTFVGDLADQARPLAQRLHRLGAGAYREGVWYAASAAFALALRCQLQWSTPDDRDTISMLRHWAKARQEEGEYDEALEGFTHALRMFAAQGTEDEDALLTANDLAVLLLERGDHAEALRILREVVAVNTRIRPGGAEAPETLTAQSNLADATKMAGDYVGAHPLADQVWRIRERSPGLGPDHPDTLTSANNVAQLLQLLGDFRGARKIQEEVLLRRRALAPDHDDTVTALANLATSIYALGHWEEAAAMEREVLAARTARFGRTHPSTLTAANNLAGSLRELGQFAEARQLLEQVLRGRLKVSGASHPETLTAMTNLADLLQEQGELDAAVRLAKRALKTREQALPPEHPDTLVSLASYAAVLMEQGRGDDALRHQTRVLEVRLRHDGPDHLETLRAETFVAAIQTRLRQFQDARQHFESVEPKVAELLGKDHPDTVEVRLSLAEVLYELRDKRHALHHAGQVAASLRKRVALDARDVDRSARLVGLLFMLRAHRVLADVFATVGTLMWRTMELLDQASAHKLIRGFRAFHETWLRYCAAQDQNELPVAMAPLHGIESDAWLRSRSDEPGNPVPDAARSLLLATRQRLADERLQLLQLDSTLHDLDVVIAQDGSDAKALLRTRAQFRARRAQCLAAEQRGLREYQAARQKSGASGQTEAFDDFSQRATAKVIQALLGEAEGVLLLAQFNDSDSAGLVIARERLTVVDLAGLDRLGTVFDGYAARQRAHSYRGGMRDWIAGTHADAAAREIVIDEPLAVTLAEAANLVRTVLWEPVGSALHGVVRLHVVYSPALRGVPLQLGGPGMPCGFYPSLAGLLHVLRQVVPATVAPSPLSTGYDCAWEGPAPIPFAEAEVRLVADLVPTRICEGDGLLAVLHSGDHGPAIQVACHGTTSGTQEDRHAVLLLNAGSGARLAPADVASLGGVIDEFFCSTCVGAVVSQRVAVDALGIVSAMQLAGTRTVIACLAPVPDFHMPVLAGLYWIARAAGRVPVEALEAAKAQLQTGDWPDTVQQAVRRVYARQMQEVLMRAQYAGEATGDPLAKADRAYRLARSVAGWILPQALQADCIDASQAATASNHRHFSTRWCESRIARQSFAEAAVNHMIEARAAWPADHRAQIVHLCAFTQCFGGLRP